MVKKDSTELLELVPAQGLGHDVRNVLVGRDELRPHGKLLNELTDLEVPSLDVLGAGVGDVVIRERNGPLIVDADITMSLTFGNISADRNNCGFLRKAPKILSKVGRVVGKQDKSIACLTGGVDMFNELV